MVRGSGAIDYVSEVRRLDWLLLGDLWHQIKLRDTIGWPPGRAFEHLILRAFELSGAKVVWPYAVQLNGETVEQIDGLVSSGNITCMIEAKNEAAAVNVEPIAKLRNQLMRRPAGVVGSVFSVSGFTDPAKTLAQYLSPQAILLWNGREIEDLLLAKQSFVAALSLKYEYLIQMGIADLELRGEDVA